MNRIYLFIFCMFCAHILIAQQSSLILTGVSRPNNNFPVENSSNTARSIELFVVEDIDDLSFYGYATSNSIYAGDQSNGSFQFPSGSFEAGDFIYLTRDNNNFENLHGFSADYELTQLNFMGGNTSGPYCVVEILYSPDWSDASPQTIDFWASNSPEYIINGGWSKRNNCDGPNPGPNSWVLESPVFTFENGVLTEDYSNFNISEWTYVSSDPNSINFGTYEFCGCTNELADNYVSIATIDDNNCIYYGCLDPLASNWDFDANTDNGSCLYEGCIDSVACNFNSQANLNDFSCLYPEPYYDCNGNCNNDANNDGICDELEIMGLLLNCDGVSVSANITDDNCDGVWNVYFDFEYENEIVGLEDVEAVFSSSSGDIFTPISLSVSDELYDLSYLIDVPDIYTVTFQTSADCNFGQLIVPINELIDVSLSYETETLDCDGSSAVIIGSLINSPPGIYDIYIDGEQVTEVSTGLDDIVFDAWQDGNSVDCEGNLLSTPENHSIALNPANGDFSEMEVGDIIGAFFVDASCGLVNAGSIVYDGGVTGGPVYGDDTSSPYSEGFSSGQEITWLLEKASDGLIYNIDITWDDTAFDSGDYWLPNGLSSMTSILITETYENTFDIELQEGSYDLAIYNGNCLLLEEASVLIEGGPSIDDISYITINNPCVDSSDGVITIDGLNNNLDYDFSIINLDVGNSFFGSAVEQSTYSFTDLPSGEYFLSYSESLCGFTNQEFLSVNFESDVPSVDLGDNVSTCETSVCLEANYDQNVGSDNSLSFNGVDNYIDAGNLNFLESDYVSYGVWIKSTGDTGSTQYIVGKSATNPGTTLGIQPDGNIYFAIGTNGTSTQGYATAINTNCNQTYFDNKWHFVVGTYDGVDIKIYVDGQLKGETELNGGPVYYGNLPFYIGYRPDNTSYFNGLISDIFIFDYALSQNEIENYFCSGVIGTESGLKAYWPMNEASGNTIYDAGPNSVNIGINSAAWSTESKPECALLSYLWSTGETSLSIDATSSESYSVEVINELGCLGIDEITVVINECGCTDVLACNYNADANEDDNSCLYIALVDLGQDIIDICEDEIILDAGEGYDTYLWSTGDNTQTIAIDESGTYSVDVSISTANNYSMYFDDGFGDGSTCGGESMEGQTYTALNEFVPSADYVIVDSFIIDPTDNITISAWAKGINSEGGIFFCSLDDSGNQSWINTLNGQGVYVGLAGGSQSLDTEFPTFNNNEWRYYSVTIEDLGNSITNISFYLDGELLNSSIETNLDIEWSGLLFGRFQYQNGAFVGAIDDVQLWDAVLSQEEIQQYMNCSPTGSEPDLIGYWNFEEGPSAGQVLDVTGNGNNGTIVCATYTNDVPSQSCEVVSCVELDEITVAFGVEGCSDQLACNYNENAVCEDDSCEYADINTDCDGNCLFGYVLIDEICVLALSGCTDENACNYDPNANTDSGLCEYADINADCNGICLDGYVLNDGFCVLIIEGCSDDNACNFNPNVTIDNGSCQYSSLIDLGSDISSCNSYTISAESGYDQYVWSNGQTTQEITVTESNTYTVTAFQTCDFGDIEGFTFLNSFSGSNYYISNETSTWDDANDICAAIYQGHLVTITSQEEDNFVYNNVSSVIPNNYWIGLSDVAIEGDFEWVTGEALIYNNWNDALGEPNNNFPGENYVEVFSDNSAYPGYWNDAPLINSSTGNPVARYYVLEIDCQCSSDGSINIAIGLDGCTDPSACNYNPDAICDDALCYNNDLGCGCDQPAAEENADCNGDCLDGYINISGFCVEEILGCTDENACNYDVLANTNDLSCYNNDLGCGCDQPVAEENADCDGDCFEGYADFGLGCELIIEGCTDETACNYNILANIDSECLYGNECGCPPLEFTNVTSNPINGTELTVEWIGGCEDLNTIYLTFNNITDNIVVANANWENDDALLPNTGIHTWNIPCYLLEEGDEYGYFIAQLYNGTSYESNTSGGNTDWESVVENGGTTILTNDPIYWGDDIEGSPGGNPCVSNTSNFPNVPTEYVCPQTDFFEYLYGSLGYNISISADLLCVGGCLDSDACNYSPDAAYDDGSCVYPVDSCTDCNGNDLGGQDCSGVCEGDFLQDDCGICDNDLNNDNEDFVINIIAIDSPCDSPDGSIIVDLNPIYPFDELSFQWYLDGSVVLGETSQNIFNIGSGNYVLEVSNNFCTLSTEEIIVQEAEPVEFTDFIISDFDGFQIDCSGNASIEIEFSGGSAPYDISVLLDGNITPVFITDVTSPVLVESLFGAGSYEFVIFSADGICQYTSTPIEFAEQEGALLVDFDNIDDCYNNSGLAQGSINVSVAGGVPPYIISYSPCTSNCFGAAIADDQIVSFDGVASGTYLVEVLDFNGCTISSEQFIETSSEIYLSVLPDSEPYNCCLEDFDNNGVCDLADESAIFNIQITGGTPPYTYSGFDNNLIPITGESVQVDDGNGQFIEIITLSNLATGDYLLSIVDDGGCAASASTLNNSGFNSLEEDDEIFVFTVNQIEPMEIEITDILEVECFGDPVSVSFSVTQTGVLTSNNFSVEVLENSTSIFTDDLEVGSLELDFCYPAMNNATSQTILINNVGILGLPALDHNLQEGDVFGLFNEVNPVLDASGYQCVGGIENGSICNDFGNGVNGFSPLEWSNGNFNNDGNLTLITWFADPGDNLGVLASNNSNWISDEIFGFVERDGLIYSCTIEFFVGGPQGFVDTYIPNTQLYISSIIVSDQPFLGGDGTVTVTFEPDSQDVYEFIFTDDYGCTQIIDMPSSDLDIPVPDAELASSINIINNPSCPEGSDGSLNVSLSGGYGAYNVSLFNGNDIQVGQIVNLEAGVSLFDFNNLSASDYYVIVSDELGCSVFSNLVIVEDLSPITIENQLIQNPSCNALNINGGDLAGPNATGSSSDGSIELIISGGTPPYNVQIESGGDLFNLTLDENAVPFSYNYFISNLNIGSYSVSIQDFNGCDFQYTVNGLLEDYIIDINQPDPLVVDPFISEILCFEGEGDIILNWSGGTPFLIGGEYQFIQPTGVDPDGVNTNITIANSAIGPNGETGYFAEEALDANGCSCFFEYYMSEPDQIELLNGDAEDFITNYNGYSTSCSGVNNGQIGVSSIFDFSGGVGEYTYDWYLNDINTNPIDPTDFGVETNSLDGVPAGTYYLVLSDENNCSNTYEFILTQPDGVGVNIFQDIIGNSFVDYDNDGEADDWLQDIEIDNDNLLIYGDYGVSCYGSENGFINISVSGGTGEGIGENYFYDWSGPNGFMSSDSSIYNLAPGVYTVVVQDQNFSFSDASTCIAEQTFLLEEPDNPVDIEVSINHFVSANDVDLVLYQEGDLFDYGVSCYGASDGLINLNANGGVGSYSYVLEIIEELADGSEQLSLVQSGQLEDLPSGNIEGLIGGNYILSVFDANYDYFLQEDSAFDAVQYASCIREMQIVITEPYEIQISTSSTDYHSNESFDGFGVSCFGASDGAIDINVFGGEGQGIEFNYAYSWVAFDENNELIDLSGQENQADLSNIPSGLYELTVFDSRLCSQAITLDISTPNNIEFDLIQPTDDSQVCFDISCYGANDGWIQANSLNSDNGEGFTYTWTRNDTLLENINDSDIENLSPGYYKLYIEDNLTGCSSVFGPILISEPELLYSSIDNVFISDFDGDLGDNDYNGYSTSCPGASDGIIGVQVEGGSGNYFVECFDSSGGLVNSISAELDPLPCEINLFNNLDFDGDGEYTSGPDGIAGTVDDICINNCNTGAVYNQFGVCVENCQNNDPDADNDGILNENDFLPYYYGPMSTIIEFNNLSSGTYSLVVSDGLCTLDTIQNIELIDPPFSLEASIEQIDSVSCNGSSDGAVTAVFQGGLPNNWNWGLYYAGTQDLVYLEDDGVQYPIVGVNIIEEGDIIIDNLPAGEYRLDIYDINGFYVTDFSVADLGLAAPNGLNFNEGCYVSLPVVIYEPPAIDMSIIDVTQPCYMYDNITIFGSDTLIDPANGVVVADLTGENLPFNLNLINNSNGVNNSFVINDTIVQFSNLSAGDYSLIVSDDNDCSEIFDFQLGWDYIDSQDAPSQIIINHLDLDADGIFDNIEMPDCEFSFDGSISFPEILSDDDPSFSYTYFWGIDLNYDGIYDEVITDQDLTNLAIGVYSLNITDDQYGCTVVYNYVLEEEYNCAEIPTGFSPNGDGVNDYWVIGAMDAYLDAEVEVYNRWGDLVFYSEKNNEYWDGKWKGKNVPTADYFYIIKDSEGVTLSHGRVTLRR